MGTAACAAGDGGRMTQGTDVHVCVCVLGRSTWADAMDDLGDVLDGGESGPVPSRPAAKPAPPPPPAESSEEEEGELPSEEGEYVEPA